MPHVLSYGAKTVLQKNKGENFLYIPLCSLSTPVASKSGSPRLMSLTRVPTHSIWSTLHHSSASRSAETSKRLTCQPWSHWKAEKQKPSLPHTNLIHKQRSWRCRRWNKSLWRVSWCFLAIELHSSHCWVLWPEKRTVTSWVTLAKWMLPVTPPNRGETQEVGGASQRNTAWQQNVHVKAMNHFGGILNTQQGRLTNHLPLFNFLKHVRWQMLDRPEVESLF